MTIIAGRTIFEQAPYFIQRVFLPTLIPDQEKSGDNAGLIVVRSIISARHLPS